MDQVNCYVLSFMQGASTINSIANRQGIKFHEMIK